MLKTPLSAKEIFKLNEKENGVSYQKGEQRVIKYGKLNKETAFRIIHRMKSVYDDIVYTLEIVSVDKNVTPQLKGFKTYGDVVIHLQELKRLNKLFYPKNIWGVSK